MRISVSSWSLVRHDVQLSRGWQLMARWMTGWVGCRWKGVDEGGEKKKKMAQLGHGVLIKGWRRRNVCELRAALERRVAATPLWFSLAAGLWGLRERRTLIRAQAA